MIRVQTSDNVSSNIKVARRNLYSFGRRRTEVFRMRLRELAQSDAGLCPGAANHTGGRGQRRGLNDRAVGSTLRRWLQEEIDERNGKRRTARRTARLIAGPEGPVPAVQGNETPDLPRRKAHQQAPRKASPCPQ